MPPVVSDPPTKEEILQIIKDTDKIGKKSVVGCQNEEEARFILFHSAFSVCSEKVRTTLHATGIPYISKTMDLKQAMENYEPEYILLRIVAWLTMDKRLPIAGEANYEWTGSSSVAANGLDLCVVPTLVDLKPPDGSDIPKVIVDSEVIVQYLVKGDKKLCPDEHMKLITKHLQLVDDMPHVAYLYDGNPIHDRRPHYMINLPDGFLHNGQVASLKKHFSEELPTHPKYSEESLLERAYKAKLAKTLKGSSKSHDSKKSSSNDYLQAAYDKGMKILNEIESDLSTSSTTWLCGTQEPTLADLMEMVSMHRLIWLGMDFMWKEQPEKFPKLTRFVNEGMMLDSINDAVVAYMEASPSKGDSPYIKEKKGWWPAFQNDFAVDMNGVVVQILRLTYKPPPTIDEAVAA